MAAARHTAQLLRASKAWASCSARPGLCNAPCRPRVPCRSQASSVVTSQALYIRRQYEEFQQTLQEPDDIWIHGWEARQKFNLTRNDLAFLGENYILKVNPYDEKEEPFKQYALKEIVSLALRKHGEQALLEHFYKRSLLRRVGSESDSDMSRKLYAGQIPDEESDSLSSGDKKGIHGRKRYWYNAPSTTTPEGWESLMQGLKANTGICAIKGAVWYGTGSHAMFADWMHSIADVANYSYRLMELTRSGKQRDSKHPYGYAPLRYITADRSFVFLGFVGGVYPLMLGVKELVEAGGVPIALGGNLAAPAVVFLVSTMLEGAAMKAAYREILSQAQREQVDKRSERSGLLSDLRIVWRYLREGRDVMSTATFTEAGSGVLSSCLGLGGLALSYHLQSGTADVVASVLMATMVINVSLFLLRKSGNALLGQTLPPWRVKDLVKKVEAHSSVVNVYDVKTELVGTDTVRFKAEVQFNPQAISERLLRANQAKTAALAEAASCPGVSCHHELAHALLAARLQAILPQLENGLPRVAEGHSDVASPAWLFRNNGLFYEALAWELKDVERSLRAELLDFKNVHIDLEPW